MTSWPVGRRERHHCASSQRINESTSATLAHVSPCPRVTSPSVGLTAPGRPQAWGLASSRAAMTCLTSCRPVARPRTSRDAGPYLARRVIASGWGLAVGGWSMRLQVQSTQHSMQHSVLFTLSFGRADRPRSAAGMGSGFVSRSDDVPDLMPPRSTSADQQGRWSLPGAQGDRERLGVSGWRMVDEASGAIDSALDAALCTLHPVLRQG